MRGISFYFTIFSSPCKEHSWGAWGRPWFARIPRLAHFSQWNPSSRRSAPRGRNVVVEAAWVGASYWFKKVNAQFIEKKRRLYNDVQCNVHTVCNWLLPWHSSRTASSSLSLWFGSSSPGVSVEESFRRSLQQLASLASQCEKPLPNGGATSLTWICPPPFPFPSVLSAIVPAKRKTQT